MTKKSTKRALVGSVVAIVLCAVMLIGTTFAWFTDTASTGVNKIQAGNLKIDIVDEADNSIKGQKLEFTDKNNNTDILWEPGVTFKTPAFKIKNVGNLALKYKLTINGVTGDSKLLDVITFSVVGENNNAVDIDTFEGHLTAGAAVSDKLYIQGHMAETAGNEYQNLTLEGVGITVVATQDTVENDSYGNTYDKNAAYPVDSETELKNALEQGGAVSLAKDVAIVPVVTDTTENTLVPQMTIKKDTALNLEGKKLAVSADAIEEDYGNASPLLMAVTGGTLTISGDGEINCEAGNNQVYGINVNGGSVVVNSGKFYGAMTAIQVQKGSLEINGGFFDMAPTCKKAVPQYAKYVVNCIDSAYKDGSAKITIKGGTFVNFDPSANPEGEGTSYVAEGYKVVSEQHGTDTWYTVVKA